MKIAASAPGRCGIIGNPSDIYGGCVVSCSVPARATCTITTETAPHLPEDQRLWLAATKRFPVKDVSVEWSTTIPRSSGLSGSTALLAATLACLHQIREEPLDLSSTDDRSRYAELVRDVELRDGQIMCGYQDAYMISHGGLARITFKGKRPFDPGPLADFQPIQAPLPFLLITTGVERLSGGVHRPMAERWLSGEHKVVTAIDRIAQLGHLGAAAIEKGFWDDLGQLMNENQAITASLGGSGEEVDELVAACIDGGALGAKLAGAGHGGTVIALAEDVGSLTEHLRNAGYTRFMQPSIEPGLRIEAL